MPRRKSRGETQPGETMYSRRRGITTGPPVMVHCVSCVPVRDDRRGRWRALLVGKGEGWRGGGKLAGDSPPKIIVPARYKLEKSSNSRSRFLRTMWRVVKRINVRPKISRMSEPSCQDIAGM